MNHYYPTEGCLAYYLSHTQMFHTHDFSDMKLDELHKILKSYDFGIQACPEVDAISFYMADHALSFLQQKYDPEEPLSKSLGSKVEEVVRDMERRAFRAFVYLWFITQRESRHLHSDDHLINQIKKEFGEVAGEGHVHFSDNASMEKMFSCTKKMGAAKLGDAVRATQQKFYKGSWGGGYGGPAWGAVSDCLVSYVMGETPANVMMDTVWTLAHNNGPIFNKGMLYEGYDAYSLQMVLDVQRAGQIPNLVSMIAMGGDVKGLPSRVIDSAKAMKSCFKDWIDLGIGDPFVEGAVVDWDQVVALGAMGNYSKFTKNTDAKKTQNTKKKHKATLVNKDVEVDKSPKFKIMPGDEVPYTNRKEIKLEAMKHAEGVLVDG